MIVGAYLPDFALFMLLSVAELSLHFRPCPRRFPTEWVCSYFCTNHCTTNLRTPSFCFRVQAPFSIFPPNYTALFSSSVNSCPLVGLGVRVDPNSPGGWNNFDEIWSSLPKSPKAAWHKDSQISTAIESSLATSRMHHTTLLPSQYY